jgi:hypothetical protein
VRNGAKHEASARIRLGPVRILQDQAAGAHLLGYLEAFERRVELGDEEGIIARQRRDERRVNREVVLDPMAGRARPPVASEVFPEEQVSSDTDIDADDAGDDSRIDLTSRDPLIQGGEGLDELRLGLARAGRRGTDHKNSREKVGTTHSHRELLCSTGERPHRQADRVPWPGSRTSMKD